MNSNQVKLAEDPVSFAIIYIVHYAQHFIHKFLKIFGKVDQGVLWQLNLIEVNTVDSLQNQLSSGIGNVYIEAIVAMEIH